MYLLFSIFKLIQKIQKISEDLKNEKSLLNTKLTKWKSQKVKNELNLIPIDEIYIDKGDNSVFITSQMDLLVSFSVLVTCFISHKILKKHKTIQ